MKGNEALNSHLECFIGIVVQEINKRGRRDLTEDYLNDIFEFSLGKLREKQIEDIPECDLYRKKK